MGSSRAAKFIAINGGALNPLSLSTYAIAVGVPIVISIVGATATSTLTASGLPSGWTLNSGARTLSGTPAAGIELSFSITETLAGKANSPKLNVFRLAPPSAVVGYDSVADEALRFATRADPWAAASPRNVAQRLIAFARRPLGDLTAVAGGSVITTSGSPNITIVTGLSWFAVGGFVVGTGIPASTTILSITGNTAVMSANASASGTVFAQPFNIVNPLSDGANSTLQPASTTAAGGGVSGNAENPLTTTTLGGPIVGNRIATVTRQTGSRIAGHASGIATQGIAPAVDFAIRCNGNKWNGMVTNLITGERARLSAIDMTQAYANSNFYKIDWGVSRAIRYEIYSPISSNFNGMNVAAGYSLRAAVFDQPRVLVIGDSFPEGSMNDASSLYQLKLNMADWYAAVFGCATPICNAVGGTGVYATAGGSNYLNYQQRRYAGDFLASRIDHQDLVYWSGSVNDGSVLPIPAGDAEITTRTATLVAGLMVDQPYSIFIGGPQQFNKPSGVPTAATPSRIAAYKAGFLAAAGNDPRMIWDENSIYKSAPDTGAIGADGIHPDLVPGSRIIGQGLGLSHVGLIRTRFGI